ncbi:GNAT family N-acetyltransferase [Azohydromonas caseinilytica]|uniref:GNAT family N-acetyltransferase n=1 Tax=Azohydromonas caseinilytica TaxID=2728836 RepID=A0A848F434_9BURK|nr:GNAT family N-acetyltransferase [Azohydromonas caseinilytica]NML14404.1 GNAT family N-acetyltransferase [Azohydromonas caseinilytica]
MAPLCVRRLEELPPDALALLARAEHDGIELGAPWLRNFLGTMPELCQGAYFHLLCREGRAVAVLPLLARADTAQRGRVQSLANYYSALWAPALDPTLTAAELALLLRDVVRRHAPLRSLHLAPMDPDSRAWALLRAALRLAGLPAWDFFAFGNWYLRTEVDWAGYLAARPGELRNTIRRAEKRLLKAGARVEIVTGGERLVTATRAYEQVYAASWKQPEPHAAFMPGLIRTCALHGWLRLGVVWLEERPIAAQLWIVAHGKAAIYKLAYDEAFKALGSGTVLTARLMCHVLDVDRVAEVDYLMGDDAYKRSWMSQRRERRGIVAYNPRSPRGLMGAAGEALIRLLKPLRDKARP